MSCNFSFSLDSNDEELVEVEVFESEKQKDVDHSFEIEYDDDGTQLNFSCCEGVKKDLDSIQDFNLTFSGHLITPVSERKYPTCTTCLNYRHLAKQCPTMTENKANVKNQQLKNDLKKGIKKVKKGRNVSKFSIWKKLVKKSLRFKNRLLNC